MGKENRKQMMEQQPDKLFHNKLSNFEKPAPAGAWDRIEASLEGKRKTAFPYWKVAAAILMIGVISYLLIPKATETPGQIAELRSETPAPTKDHAEQSLTQPTEDPGKNSNGVDVTSSENGKVKSHVNTPGEPKASEGKSKIVNRKDTSNEHASSKVPSEVEPSIAMTEKVTESDDVEIQTTEAIALAEININETNAGNVKNRESVTLVMTVDDTNAYLKKNTEDGATSGNRKTSTLKRVLQKASELKNNDQDPIGELRQMKNEILALNFKSGKQRDSKQVN